MTNEYRSNKVLFILSNIVGLLLEYAILLVIFRLVFNNTKLSIVFLCILFLLNSSIVLIALCMTTKGVSKEVSKEASKEINNDNNPTISMFHDDFIKLIDKVNREYHKNIKLAYIDSIEPSIAWNIGSVIYINTRRLSDSPFVMGVIGHEIGHAVSGLSLVANISSIKPSSFISRVLFVTIASLSNSNKITIKIFNNMLLYIYYLVSLNNRIFVYKYLRRDEHYANLFACSLGYGHHVRCYYKMAMINDDDKMAIIRKIDYMHPSIDSMINCLNKKLNITNKDYYYIDDTLYFIDNSTKTITLSDNIFHIDKYAFYKDNIKKITSNTITCLDYLITPSKDSIEVLSFSKLESIDFRLLKSFTKLRKLIISNNDQLFNELSKYIIENNLRINIIRKEK